MKKCRPKGMGSVTYLGKGRRKPFLATLSDRCLGTYKTRADCEKALLCHVMRSCGMIPSFINDNILGDYIAFIYDMQCNLLLPDSVYEFPDLGIINDMFRNQLKASGKYIEDSEEIIEAPTFSQIWEKEYERLGPLKSDAWRRSRSAAFRLMLE